VPADAEQAFFLNLKPEGEAGRHWQQIRERIEAHAMGEEVLSGMLGEFKTEQLGLGDYASGPAVSGYRNGVNYTILPVDDGPAARDALHDPALSVSWEQVESGGEMLYFGQRKEPPRGGEWLAWTIHDDLLYITSRWSAIGRDEGPLTELQALLGLAEEDSLAELPSWRMLRRRLPHNPMGLIFFNVAEQARSRPPAPSDTSLSAALGQQTEAFAAAAVPEEGGMRVDVVGAFDLTPDAPSEFQALLTQPAVDPAAWTSLPAGTAIALIAHDASVVWPWLNDFFRPRSLAPIREATGLDVEVDLASADGPLAGEFALGITPPLPDQPISQRLTAAQLLILTEDASEAQMAGLQDAMETRGAIFGPGEAGGVPLQTQVGTGLAGYAISYGFDDGALLFGSSPNIIGQGIAAQREGSGLVQSETFRAMEELLLDDPSFVIHVDGEPLLSLVQANMTEEQFQRDEIWHIFQIFDAIGLGFELERDRLDGIIYFFVE
jgi:hypothetical protein